MSTEESNPHAPSIHEGQAQNEVSNFHDDNLSVAVTKKPHCQIKFEVTVSPKAVQAAYEKAAKTVNKEVSIPGFRKGRAPSALINEKYQPVIEKECADIVLQTGFNEALQLTHLHPLKDGHIKRPVIRECSREKGARFIIEFEGRPHIPSINLEDLQIKKESLSPITEKECDNALYQLTLQFTTYEPVEGRGVQEGDFINLNVELLEDAPREVIHDQRAQVNAMGLPDWIRQKVIGLQAGETVEGMTAQDMTLTEPNPDFRSVPFRATVLKIWQGQVPPLDDELAKRVGVESLDALRQKLRHRLEQNQIDESFNQNVHSIEETLLQKYPLDLPQSYIDANKTARLEGYLKQIEEKDQQLDDKNLKQLEQMAEQNAIQQLQLFFLFSKVAADHQIKVDDQEISQELARQVSLISSGRSQINLQNEQGKLKEQLYNLAFDRKVKQFLVDHATFID